MKLIYLKILQVIAKLQLLKNKPLVIGVTGSAGKSSCVKAIKIALEKNLKIKATSKGNSETGVPLEILNIKIKNYQKLDWLFVLLKAIWRLLTYWPNYKILIAELAIDSDVAPKNMAWHLNLLKPQIGVLLNVSHVHLEYFKNKNIKFVLQEKAKLIQALPPNGLAILNFDQDLIRKDAIYRVSAPKKFFSLNHKTNIYLLNHQINLAGSQFEFNFKNKIYNLNFKNNLIFKNAFGSFAAALLVADYFDLNIKNIIKNLENNFDNLPGRGKIFTGINNSILIDSSYNSSLEPTSASLEMLSKIAKKTNRKIAILGDMRELGEKAKQDHQKLLPIALKNADLIFTIGPLTQKYFKNHKKIIKFNNSYQALKKLKAIIKPQDIILIKGSQNTILLEIITEGLLKDKKNKKYLCRQGKYWDLERAKLRSA